MFSNSSQAILKRADSLRTEATSLLYESGLIEDIGAFGETLVIGSYGLNLMVRRDIDINLRLPHEHDIETFFALGSALAKRHRILKASYSNHFIRQFPGFDHGLYWGVQLFYQDHIWKLDLWGHGSRNFNVHRSHFETLQRQLKVADRFTILQLKNADKNGLEGIRSINIYQAILTANIGTLEELRIWWQLQAKHP